MSFEKRRIELIYWVDSNRDGGWDSNQKYGEYAQADLHCRTIGMVSFESKDRVSLVHTDSALGGSNGQMTIPKGAIVSRTVLVDGEKLQKLTNYSVKRPHKAKR